MASERITQGPTARTVAVNVQRLRKARGFTTQDLSRELDRLGRPILPTGITKIEHGNRRVDVDDLMALAVALRVTPSTLLLPHTTGQDEIYEITGASGLPAHQVWDWADGDAPLLHPDDDETDLDFQLIARPKGRRVMRALPGRDFGSRGVDDLYPDGIDWSQTRLERG